MNFILNFLLLLREHLSAMGEKYPPDHLGNFSDSANSFVVGIPLSPSTVYVDNPIDNRNCVTPNEFGPRKRSNTSFQITSVTVQGSRMNNEELDDSADDYDESHTDDISSDILDSRTTEPDGYQSEDTANTNFDDLSPCGPLIITPLPSSANDPNMNVGLGINMSAPFPAVASNMVSSGVTMMTSNTESPASAQVPMINSLPDNWQHRFRVVKIVSSEPFKRGRWLCMDFKDPPQHSESNRNSVPAIQVTPCSGENNHHSQGADQNTLTHVIGIPVTSAFTSSVPVCPHDQPIYGILVPQEHYNEGAPTNEFTAVQNTENININKVQDMHVNVMNNYNYVDHQNCSGYSLPVSSEHDLNNNMNRYQANYQIANGHEHNTTYTNSMPNYNCPPNNINPHVVPVPPDRTVQAIVSKAESSESAASSGASTVAIDNKIEQAMDLVKSHLMFAVREEVEVLKEKITELLERISQLEHENDILRANASPETLKQLNQSQKKFTGHPMIGKQHGAPHLQNQPPAL